MRLWEPVSLSIGGREQRDDRPGQNEQSDQGEGDRVRHQAAAASTAWIEARSAVSSSSAATARSSAAIATACGVSV